MREAQQKEQEQPLPPRCEEKERERPGGQAPASQARDEEPAGAADSLDVRLTSDDEPTPVSSRSVAERAQAAKAAAVAPRAGVDLKQCWVDRNRTKFACQPGADDGADTNVNAIFTAPFEKLADIYESLPDEPGGSFKAKGFMGAARKLKRLEYAIVNAQMVREWCANTGGVGDSVRDCMLAVLRSGTMPRMELLLRRDDVVATSELQKVWGVGPAAARQFIQRKIMNLAQLRQAVARGVVALSHRQKVGLELAEELEQRMPREEAGRIAAAVAAAAKERCPGARAVACGSFRRGKESCGDVDVLITHDDPRCLAGLMRNLLIQLDAEGFLTHHLVVPRCAGPQHVPAMPMEFPTKMGGKGAHGSELPASYMGVCLAPGGKLGVPRVHRRIDIKIYPPAMLPFATLYFTGSGHFNRSMRLFCKKKGLKLSDQGLWRREGEAFIHCADEKAIFSACGLEWVEPHARSV